MMTTIKPKKANPVCLDPNHQENVTPNTDPEITVEQYLEGRCEEVISALKQHTESLIEKLRREFEIGVSATKDLMDSTISHSKQICVILKVTKGAHIGQKFRLEAIDGDDVFKIGRSTAKYFKEKGVSLYKDKEISSTHARIELRNGQAFLLDCKSTNGSLLNNEECQPLLPYRLKEGDLIGIGNTEVRVHVSQVEGEGEGEGEGESGVGTRVGVGATEEEAEITEGPEI